MFRIFQENKALLFPLGILYFNCQDVRCDCLVDGILTGTPHEASGRFPRWKPDAGRNLTGKHRAFFMRFMGTVPIFE
jgi:hypothetical protein